MQIQISPHGWIALEERLGIAGRVMFVLFALLPLWGAYELRGGLSSFTIVGVLVGIICAGGVLLSSVFLWVAIFSPSRQWRIERDSVIVETVGILAKTRRVLTARDVLGVRILSDTWSDGPNSYRLEFATATGPLITPSTEDKTAIEDLLARARQLLAVR